MHLDDFIRILWRRKWTLVITVILTTGATYFVSKSLPKVYSSTATLFVGDRNQAGSDFEAVQSGQVLAKTYAELIQSRNVAARVALRTPDNRSSEEVLELIEVKPVSDTQLVLVTAEGDTGEEAANLANTYTGVFAEYATSELSEQTRSDVSIADVARPPTSPVRPKPALYAGVMLVFSLFLGTALAVLRDRFDTKLGDDKDIGRELDLPILARIPRVSRKGKESPQMLEAFRILRTNLSFLDSDSTVKTVVVTSASPGEGKSTTAIGLARAAAENSRVVLIEGDLRRPSLSSALQPEGSDSTPGLVHYLAMKQPIEDVLHATDHHNLFLIPAGAVPPNPSALLQSSRLSQLMDEALSWGDLVIIDSAPLEAGADASILSHSGRTVLFVVNHRTTRRSRAVAAIARLRQTQADVAGLIVNELPMAFDNYYGYYGGSHDEPVNPPVDEPEPLVSPSER